jgi:hypothetical protein
MIAILPTSITSLHYCWNYVRKLNPVHYPEKNLVNDAHPQNEYVMAIARAV